MAKIDSIVKEGIANLTKPDLVKLVIKAVSTNKQLHDYVLVNYIDKANGEKELFEQAKLDLENLFSKSYRGYSRELVMANMLAACNKRIGEFAKVCKNKSLEVELIFFVLEIPFSASAKHFGTCFTKYDYQVYLLVKKAVTLVKTKLHEDYHIEFAPKLNEYLHVLHSHSNHLDYVYSMPKSI
jgi:hypothetical protein